MDFSEMIKKYLKLKQATSYFVDVIDESDNMPIQFFRYRTNILRAQASCHIGTQKLYCIHIEYG